jgi:Fe-S cluster assembly protein SufD
MDDRCHGQGWQGVDGSTRKTQKTEISNTQQELDMLETKHTQDYFLAAFEDFERSVADTDTPWLRPIRNAAIARFAELGFPGPHSEDWRFTNLAPLLKVPFQLAESREVGAEILRPHLFKDAWQLVCVNGCYRPELSRIDNLPSGLEVADLATALERHGDLVETHLARYARHEDLPFTALNTAFLKDGAFVHVQNGILVEKPIHIVHVATARTNAGMAFPRNLIVADRSSQVTVVESYVSLDDHVHFTDAVTEIVAAENASVDHYKVLRAGNQAFHIANTQVRQERASRVSSHYIALSGGLVRNESRTVFAGEGGECTFNGLYLGRGKQHLDNFTVIDHAMPHCTSHELYRGVLDEKSRGVFNGKIYVRPDAQKTDAKQTNQVLLLSDDATINTKPQLEIFADDVKCTHGATVGQLEENALFYLRSRGVGLEQARSLLVFAFANDIIQRIKVEAIRLQLEEVLLTRQHLPRYEEL